MSFASVIAVLGGLAVTGYLLLSVPQRWLHRHNENRKEELTEDLIARKERASCGP